jgi:outer membrane receptor protein involved in Fe transport
LKIKSTRERLLASSMICGAAFVVLAAGAAQAQEQGEVQEVVVTGSRIVRQDYVAASPIATVTGEQATANADVTLDMYLNTLPQVSPAASSTSNNPGNNGQSTVDLRGLGSNRNLVLVDGRRPMVSNNTLTVDLNTVPQAMIENIEVITGGAGATYGADAVAGVVNLKLKRNFEGVDFRASYTDATEYHDAKEYQFSLVVGGNFSDGKGNALFGFDRSYREPVTKGQRPFSALATSTTGTPPAGAIRYNAGNAIPLAAVQALFQSYGITAPVGNGSGSLGFNLDGSLFYGGVGNNPTLQVQNFKYPVDVNVNTRFYPDFYSYNFDAPNLLTLPLDRYSFMSNLRYEFDNGVEVFTQAGWTEYTANQALAPTPIPTVVTAAPGTATNLQVSSALVTPGSNVGTNLIVPVTNPYIPNDLRTLLAARTGDDPALVGSGATEPFLFAFRPLGFGAQISEFKNTVVQYMAGVKFPIGENFKGEAYISQGRTEILRTQYGNINTQLLSDILAHPTQSPNNNAACANQNFFGDRPLLASCRTALESPVTRRELYTQTIAQAFVSGNLFEVPAGPVPIVLGAEHREFDYSLRFLSTPGPFSGFTVGDPEAGTSSFNDIFAETLIPIVKDKPFFNSFEIGLGARYSWARFGNELTGQHTETRGSATYKAELNWEVMDWARVRASFQRAVREPNFQELFVGTASAPQIFDPCSAFTAAWKASGTGAGTLRGLCAAQGVPATGATTSPGSQANIFLNGNINLNPEKANTITLGVVLSSPWDNQWLQRLRGSIDYYNLEIKDPIITFDTNTAIAACFNYFGTNPNYSNSYLYCSGMQRTGGNLTNARINNPNAAPGTNNAWLFENGGIIKTSGLDFQLEYGFDWDWLGAPEWMGAFQANILVTHVLNYEQSDRQGLPPVDYTGTISYFGAGLGTSFPEWKATLNTRFNLGRIGFMGYQTEAVSLGARVRYIGDMDNRQFRQYPGETFLGTAGVPSNVPATYYVDLDATWGITDNVELKIGVNNVTDQDPRLYAPNTQSGTDPSTYDVIGRRAFGQIKLRF